MRIAKQWPYSFHLSSYFWSLFNFIFTLQVVFVLCLSFVSHTWRLELNNKIAQVARSGQLIFSAEKMSENGECLQLKSLKLQRRSTKIMVNCFKNRASFKVNIYLYVFIQNRPTTGQIYFHIFCTILLRLHSSFKHLIDLICSLNASVKNGKSTGVFSSKLEIS